MRLIWICVMRSRICLIYSVNIDYERVLFCVWEAVAISVGIKLYKNALACFKNFFFMFYSPVF